MDIESTGTKSKQHCIMNADKRSKVLVFVILSACIGGAVLLGFLLFELPWSSENISDSAAKHHSKEWTMLEVENDGETQYYLERLESMEGNYSEKADKLLQLFPVIDGHNDLAWNIRNFVHNDLRKVNFTQDLTQVKPWSDFNESHTDIPRLLKGRVGGQFWVAYADCQSQGKDAVLQTLEQIDVIHRFIEAYPNHFKFCTTAQCIIETSFKKNAGERKIASLIGVEGGHMIQSSPGVLRQLYQLGARYLTLTHGCSTPWSDASPIDDPEKNIAPVSDGLSPFGLELMDEMNRIGMMIDISHVSEATMIAALKSSRAPVIFSHSGAKAICNVHRNVGDDVLRLLQKNGGIIMVNFYSEFIECDKSAPRLATLLDVVRHINHIRDVIGVDHIGLGGDYDGVDSMPLGLEDVSKYPHLFESLIEQGWRLNDLKKIAYTNILRVMEKVEQVKLSLASATPPMEPMQSIISVEELTNKNFTASLSCGLSHKSLARLSEPQILKEETQENMPPADQPIHLKMTLADDDRPMSDNLNARSTLSNSMATQIESSTNSSVSTIPAGITIATAADSESSTEVQSFAMETVFNKATSN